MSKAPDDISIAEHFDGHTRGRPISWVVVALVCGGFIVGGVGLMLPAPWLVYVGLGIAAIGAIVGGLTHAMSGAAARVETPARRANAAEGPQEATSEEQPARG